MKKFLVIGIFLGAGLLAKGSIYTKLKDPQLVSRFKEISDQIICQCGCQLPLNMCNHNPCVAWAIRDIIEKLLLKGYSNDQIVNGFIHGFGKKVFQDKAFAIAFTEEYKGYDLVKLLENGFGEAGRTEPVRYNIMIWIFISALLVLGSVLYFLKKRHQTNQQVSLTEEEKKQLLQDLQNKDDSFI